MSGRHAVWFERTVLPELAASIAERCEILGPAQATPDVPFSAIKGARGIVAGVFDYGADVMDLAPDVRVIARTGIGVDKVDLAAATARGVAVCNAPDGPTIPTAEHAVALMMAAAKRLKPAEAALRHGAPGMFARHASLELDGKTLGLVGYGRIARRVAAIASAIGMHVVAHDPHLDPVEFGDTARFAELDTMLAVADVVSVHIPLTPESRRLFDAVRFRGMKAGAIFVNTARGGIVDLDDLIAALDGGILAAAGLDVTDPEPLPPQHPILDRTDVIVTPHIASASPEGKRRMLATALDQVITVLDGERPAHLVNPEAWDHVLAAVTT